MRIEITGIDEMTRQILNYMNTIDAKMHTLIEKLGDIGVETADLRFRQAEYDGYNDVSMEKTHWVDDNTLEIVASGTTVLFIEFGTGQFTGAESAALGMGRGSYGYHLGKLDSWRYVGDPGTNGEVLDSGEVLTKGNPPARAMYEAAKEMRFRIEEVAKEVFRFG